MAIGSYSECEKDKAEVAFLVKEDLQGLGIGTYLLEILEIIARENGYKGFVATTLTQNIKMIRVFQKQFPNLTTEDTGGGEIEIDMPFT